jgi:hypothetical protein
MKTRAASLAATALVVLLTATTRAQDGPFGVVERRDGGGAPYALTATDALWAARMLVGESGGQGDVDDEAVLWCMLNSYMIRPVRSTYPTFTSFVRAYCTPLQPYLKSKGAVERHRRLGTPMVEVAPGRWQLRRHLQLQRRAWADLPAGARDVVTRVFAGRAPTPCGNATQFCSTATYFHDHTGRRPSDAELVAYTEDYARGKRWRWVRVAGSSPRSNCFFVEERFATLPAAVVRVAAPAHP